jgi:hypothetical protein
VSAAAQRRSTRAGEVAERSNAADCKSVALAASEVRILPSPPAFARRASFGWQPVFRMAASPDGFTMGDVSVGAPAVSGRGEHEGGSNSVVESQPSKLLVAGSIPVSRSNLRSREQA